MGSECSIGPVETSVAVTVGAGAPEIPGASAAPAAVDCAERRDSLSESSTTNYESSDVSPSLDSAT